MLDKRRLKADLGSSCELLSLVAARPRFNSVACQDRTGDDCNCDKGDNRRRDSVRWSFLLHKAFKESIVVIRDGAVVASASPESGHYDLRANCTDARYEPFKEIEQASRAARLRTGNDDAGDIAKKFHLGIGGACRLYLARLYRSYVQFGALQAG